MTTLQVLREARELIADRDRWCRRYSALDPQGWEVSPEDSAACRWCSAGAVRRVSANPELSWSAVIALEKAILLDPLAKTSILTDFNDRRGHAAVIDLFDRAITQEER